MYVHWFEPEIFRIGPVAVRWYGMMYLVGFAVGYFILKQLARRRWLEASVEDRIETVEAYPGPAPVGWLCAALSKAFPLAVLVKFGTRRKVERKKNEVDDLIFFMIVGVILGARMGYAIFYQPGEYFTLTGTDGTFEFRPIRLLYVWQGGMSSHGGFIGVLAGIFFYCRKYGRGLLNVADAVTLAAPLGLMFGRLGNFINGELYGRPAPDTSPFAMRFPMELFSSEKIGTMPDWMREFILPGGMAAIPEKLADAGAARLYYYAGGAPWDIIRRVYKAGRLDELAPYLTPRYPSQLFQSFSEGLLLFLILLAVTIIVRKRNWPNGVVAAGFLVFYGVFRIICEYYRQWDEGIDLYLGLSRGQWISFGLFPLAAIFLWAGFVFRGREPLMRTLAENRERAKAGQNR